MSQSDPVHTIRLSGELEIGRKNEIRNALSVSDNAGAVLLDLGDVTYADSIALTELLRFCVNSQRNDLPVALVIRTPQFARLIKYAGLAAAFKIFDDRADALAYLMERVRG